MRATQLPILVVLGADGDVSVRMLAEALSVDDSALGRDLKVLEDRGLIRIAEREEDTRAPTLSLTPEGSRVLAGALELLQAVQHSVVGQLGRPRLQALYDELDALSAAVSD
ncbi:MAG TPA: MarR family winged helix-turn-helix transcriptional regulator [Solirubrobacteraceae bacterium]